MKLEIALAYSNHLRDGTGSQWPLQTFLKIGTLT